MNTNKELESIKDNLLNIIVELSNKDNWNKSDIKKVTDQLYTVTSDIDNIKDANEENMKAIRKILK